MVNRQLLHAVFFCLTTLAGLICMPAFAAVTASVDRTALGIHETFQLTLTLDDTSFFSDPDTSVLEKDFSILGRQQSSQSSLVNGQRTSVTEWRYQLAPKNAGIITIPAIEIDGEKTEPLTIKVSGSSNSTSADSSKPVFMEALVDKKSVYVQEQLLFTLRINTALNLHNLQLLEKPDIPNAFMVEVSNTHYERNINNTPYITYEIVYAVFPQGSGTLEIPSIAAQGINPGRSNFNSFFGGGQQISMQSEPVSVDVKAIPAAVGNNPWLPAKSLVLRETWSADPENIRVGDSITRTITATAEGLSGDQLPTITIAVDNHFKAYPDQPLINDAKNNEGIVGERKESITLVATQAGDVTLPAISIQWWDINSNQLQTAQLPAVTLKVHGDGSGGTAPSMTPQAVTPPAAVVPKSVPESVPESSPTPASTPGTLSEAATSPALPWQIATAVSSALALLFLGLFMYERKKPQEHHTDKTLETGTSNTQELTALQQACQAGNPAAIRNHLLAWARLTFPQIAIHSTSDISLACPGAEIRIWVNLLDACLYNGDSSSHDWMQLYRLVAQRHASLQQKQSGKLQPLYPE